MFSAKLIERIDHNWEKIAAAVIGQARRDEELSRYEILDEKELYARARDLVHNLAGWLISRDETELQLRYRALGKRRFEEGFFLSEVVYKFQLVERKIIEYVQDENAAMSALDMYGEIEMLRSLHSFFSIVIYGLVRGYEETARTAGGNRKVGHAA